MGKRERKEWQHSGDSSVSEILLVSQPQQFFNSATDQSAATESAASGSTFINILFLMVRDVKLLFCKTVEMENLNNSTEAIFTSIYF